jgi:Uma2 family endonuclease
MATAELTEGFCPDTRVTLHGIPWEVYARLRDEPANRNLRMTYDRGELQLMSPSRAHERFAALLGKFITVWAEEMDLQISDCRTMTIRREDIDRGFESDNCYYVQNEPLVWDKDELDFTRDPPPDLAIEVELGRRAGSKMRIYASFRVRELWVFDGRRLQLYTLGAEGRYVRCAASACLPGFPLAKVEEMLAKAKTSHEMDLVRSFRRWVRRESRGKGKRR